MPLNSRRPALVPKTAGARHDLQQRASGDCNRGQDDGKDERVAVDRAPPLSQGLRFLFIADRLGTVVQITQTACSQTYSRLGARLQDTKQPAVDRNEDRGGPPTNGEVREGKPHRERHRDREANDPARRSHATLLGADVDQTDLGVIHRRLVHRKLVDAQSGRRHVGVTGHKRR